MILGKGVVQLICLVLLDRVLAARLPVILCHLAVPALFVAKYWVFFLLLCLLEQLLHPLLDLLSLRMLSYLLLRPIDFLRVFLSR